MKKTRCAIFFSILGIIAMAVLTITQLQISGYINISFLQKLLSGIEASLGTNNLVLIAMAAILIIMFIVFVVLISVHGREKERAAQLKHEEEQLNNEEEQLWKNRADITADSPVQDRPQSVFKTDSEVAQTAAQQKAAPDDGAGVFNFNAPEQSGGFNLEQNAIEQIDIFGENTAKAAETDANRADPFGAAADNTAVAEVASSSRPAGDSDFTRTEDTVETLDSVQLAEPARAEQSSPQMGENDVYSGSDLFVIDIPEENKQDASVSHVVEQSDSQGAVGDSDTEAGRPDGFNFGENQNDSDSIINLFINTRWSFLGDEISSDPAASDIQAQDLAPQDTIDTVEPVTMENEPEQFVVEAPAAEAVQTADEHPLTKASAEQQAQPVQVQEDAPQIVPESVAPVQAPVAEEIQAMPIEGDIEQAIYNEQMRLGGFNDTIGSAANQDVTDSLIFRLYSSGKNNDTPERPFADVIESVQPESYVDSFISADDID